MTMLTALFARLGSRRSIGKAVLLLVGVLSFVGITAQEVRAQELIVNGGFEDPPLDPGTGFFTTSDLPGWTVFGPDGGFGNVDVILGYWPPAEGNQSLDLVGSTGVGTGIEQSFATVVGQTYVLTFQYANNVDATFAVGNVNVTGAATLIDAELRHEASTRADMNYLTFSVEFEADSESTTLRFTHLDSDIPGFSGLALDAVSVQAVP